MVTLKEILVSDNDMYVQMWSVRTIAVFKELKIRGMEKSLMFPAH